MKLLFAGIIIFANLIVVYAFDPSKVVLAIDCGSSSYQSSTLGFTYHPDNYYDYGWTWSYQTTISSTQNQAPYQTVRYYNGNMEYSIPVSYDGSYVLILQFADIGWTSSRNRFTIKLGNYYIKSDWDLRSEVGYSHAYDIFIPFTLSYGHIYINSSYYGSASNGGKIGIKLYANSAYAHISGIILLKGDCSHADGCNMCYNSKCTSCDFYSATCSNCIANASPVNGICNCNLNSYYVNTTNICTVCDKLCSTCYGPNPFQCNSCPSTYYLVSNVCLKACPYGFSTSCSIITYGTVIDQSFANNFNGVYGIFRTGSSESSYYFFHSPENSDPIPAKNRGLYFSAGSFLETISNVYFSISFSLGIWIWISPGSGNILTHNNRIRITETGSLDILLENHLESTLRVATNNLMPPNSAWVYISYIISFSSPSTTITSYLNNVAQIPTSHPGYIYRDLSGYTITLGKSSFSTFKGFIYQFQLWNSAVSDFNYQYWDQLCGAGLQSSCLWSCDIISWTNDGKIFPCSVSCSKGCIGKDFCNVCYDPLCKVCRGFGNGLCDQCTDNASGTPCSCNPGYMPSKVDLSCIPCIDGSSSCNWTELPLNENIIYNENLLPSEWKFYKVPFYQGHKNITLFLAAGFSMPQVYINLNSNNISPYLSSANYSSTKFVKGTLEIKLNSDSFSYINCNSKLKGHHDPNKQCAFHIGIFAPLYTEYSIWFKSIFIIPQIIHKDNPIESSMVLYEHKFYYGILDANGTSAAKINSFKGKTSLYISLFDYELAGKDPAKWPLPYDSSNSFNTSKEYDGIKFKKDYLSSICPSGKCLIEICEICWSKSCQAELFLLSQSYMKPNAYYNAKVCLNCFHYFEIPFYYGHKNIKIVFAANNSSDAGLYINLNTNNDQPDINIYDYKLIKSEGKLEGIILKYDLIAQNNCPINLTARHEGENLCIYHIGVYGFSSAHYSLIYYENDLSDTLRAGSVQVKPIGSNRHGIYYSIIDSRFDAIINVDELISGVMIISIYDYVTVKNDISELTMKLDSKTTIIVENDSDSVNLNSDSLKSWCTSKTCFAKICLHCPEQECYPKLKLDQDNEILIEEKIPYRDLVDEFTYKDYKIPFSYGHKITTVELNIEKGDVEMYISLNDYNARPTSKIYDYKSNSKSSKKITLTNDNIALHNCPQFEGSGAHENADSCYYHIGIFGKKTSWFSIQFYSTSALPTELQNNSPALIKNKNKAEDRFFYVMNTEKNAIIRIERFYGETLLYISIFDYNELGADSAYWPLPKYTTKKFKSKSTSSEEIAINNDELKEVCPSEICIALLCNFCLSDLCKYELEAVQKPISTQKDLLIHSSQSESFLDFDIVDLVLLGFVILAVLAIVLVCLCRRKIQCLGSKKMEKLVEPLIN